MRRTSHDVKRDLSFILAGMILGVGLGFFVHGYWLIDIFPVGSRQLLFFTVATCLLGMVGYYLLLKWAWARFLALRRVQQLGLGGWSFLLGLFLFFIGTYQWGADSRYLIFFLPSHQLQISIVPGSTSAGMAVLWFNTSLGDVSYDAIADQGWKREDNELVLKDSRNNRFSWTGKTGSAVQLVLRSPAPGQMVMISWDGQVETVSLPPGKYTYTHSFQIPFYASREFVVALGVLNFTILALALSLLVWRKRLILIQGLGDSLSGAAGRLGILDLALLLGAAALTLLLRGFNLQNLFPAVDEYYHLIAARQIVEGAALGSVYQRSLWVVTLPVSIALRVFGYELWAARLVGVLFSTLAILPLYLLTRKINRPIAILSCFLYATSPWLITFARLVREYAYYPFYFYSIIYGMILFIEGFPDRFVFHRDWRVLLKARMGLLGLALTLPLLYALYADRLSTFRVILIAYFVFGVFTLRKFDLGDKRNFRVVLLLGSGVLIAGVLWFIQNQRLVSIYPRLNPVPALYFFPNPQQQWYFNRLAVIPALGFVAALLLSVLGRSVNFIPSFLFSLYGGFLGFFVFFSKDFFHTRHLSTTQLWYVLLMAIGLYVVGDLIFMLFSFKRRSVHVFLVILVAMSVVNGQQTLLPTLSRNPDMPISEDYFHDMSLVDSFMRGHAGDEDVLISTVYGLYTSWRGEPRFGAVYRITTKTPEEYVLSIVDRYQSGWIVIDRIRLDLGSVRAKDLSAVEEIEYVGSFGDEYVWHWKRSSESSGIMDVLGTMR
jgi:hypothetical protein